MSPKDAAGSRRRLPTVAREREILDGAVRFFSERGLGADTRALAEYLQMSHGLIFRYFPTKAELLDRVFEHIVLAEQHPVWEAILRDRSTPLQTRLERFYDSVLERIDHPEWLRIMMHASLAGSDATIRYYEDHFRPILDIIALELRHELGSTKRGPVRADERETIFILHAAVYYYLIRRHISRISPAERDAGWLPRTVAIFMDGVRAQAAP